MAIPSWTNLSRFAGSAGPKTIIADDIAARDELIPVNGMTVVVIDAKDDPTVSSGAATYIWRAAPGEWIKISEAESMDVILEWTNIQNGPLSSAAQIDTAVAAVGTQWSRAGNTDTDPTTDFLGTTDVQPLVFKTDNLRRMIVGTNGNVGINLSTDLPGQLLHLGDGNILLEGGGETAMLFKRGQTLTGETTYGTTHPNAPFINPIFQIGRIIQGGDGAPQFRWMFAADNHTERVVFELDSEGILSSVRQSGVRGSHFEAHREGDAHPLFRLNSYPYMQLQMGPGGPGDTDIAIMRGSANTGFLQVGPPANQETILEWSNDGIKINNGSLIFPDDTIQSTAGFGAPGVSQVWQNVSASRTLDTVYQNTSNSAISVSVQSDLCTIVVGSTLTPNVTIVFEGTGAFNFIVPKNHYYKVQSVNASSNIVLWAELR